MSKFGSSNTQSGNISKLIGTTSSSGANSFADLNDCFYDSTNCIVVNSVKYTKYTDYIALRNRIEYLEQVIQAHFGESEG
jgi:hypothetical protein